MNHQVDVEQSLRHAHQRTGDDFTRWCDELWPTCSKHKLALAFNNDSVCCKPCEPELIQKQEEPVVC